MTTLNEKAILDYYSDLTDEMTIGEAVGKVLENLDTAEQQDQVFGELLLPQIVAAFAVKFNSLDETFIDNDSSSLQYFWEAFLNFEHLESFENILAQAINDVTREAYDAGINEEEESDDAGVINSPFEKLSSDDRVEAVAAFLKALANAHNDITNIRPFIKQKIGPDYLGNNFGEKVNVRSNRYGPAQETIDESGPSRKHFQATADIIRAIENPQKRQEWADHHAKLFTSQNPRFDAVKFHKAAGTKYSGMTTIKETRLLPSTPITEQLLDPQTNKIQRYADFMAKNDFFKNQSNSPKNDLIEAAKLKAEHDKKFGLGKSEAEWDPTFDGRTKGRRK